MNIVCSQCRAPVASTDIRPTTGLARCRACDVVFDVQPQLKGAAASLAPLAPLTPLASTKLLAPRRPLVMRPAAISVTTNSAEGAQGYRAAYAANAPLEIRRRWSSASAYMMLLFSLLWNAAMLRQLGTSDSPLTNEPFQLLLLGAGLWMTYTALAQIFNTTVIRATASELSIHHGPFPWPSPPSVEIQSVERLACETVTWHGKGGKSVSFKLSARLRGGRKVALLSGLTERNQALFIEQCLEEHLGLPVDAVAGKFER